MSAPVAPRARRAAVLAAALTLVAAAGCGGGGGDAARSPTATGAPPDPAGGTDGVDVPPVPALVAESAGVSEPAPGAVGVANLAVDAARTAAFPAARVAAAGPLPAHPQRPGDPARGREALLGEDYVACGIPEGAYRRLLGDAPVPTLPGREGPAADLPFFNNRIVNDDGVALVTNNCLTCHGTPLFGEIVVGLGNEFLDFTDDASLAVERAGALVSGEAEIAAWERYADRVAAIAPHMRTRTVGTNPANNITFALIAHRDPETNAWLEEPAVALPPTEAAPVSVPPWWRMKKKHAMFWMGEGRGDHARIMMAASILCSDSIEELEEIDAYAPDVRAFIDSIEPPPWPFELDEALAARGEGLFGTHCAGCHGRYGDAGVEAAAAGTGEGTDPGRYPNLLIPLEVVGTDPTLVEHAYSEAGLSYTDWFNRSWYGRAGLAAAGPGYVAPPLDGIWATAPYGHNGSVPNLTLWLDSTARPRHWRSLARSAEDPADFDAVNVGWRHETLDAGQDAYADPAERARVYDTTLPGHDNGGHRFGDGLDADERAAVVEYLKSL